MRRGRAAILVAVLFLVPAIFVTGIMCARPTKGTPERAADDLLQMLRAGLVRRAFERLPDDGVGNHAREWEPKYPLRLWWIESSTHADDAWTFRYRALRGYNPGPEDIFVTVRNVDGAWNVVQYSAVY